MVPYLIHDAINELVHDEDAADLLHKVSKYEQMMNSLPLYANPLIFSDSTR